MKKLYILGLSVLSIASINAQNIFSSDLSSWTSGEPDGFMGSKSHTTDLTVTEITIGADHGTSTARLEVANGSSHRRFSTQPLSVTDGQGYEVVIYAKGEGELRVGMFDDHTPTTSAGYISYTPYTTISTTTTTEYNFTVVATNTASNAEFIISVINTVAPNHIEIDSVAINEVTVAPPSTVSVYDIQYTTDPSGDSPYKDQIVSTGGIVYHVRADGKFYMSSGTGPWSGIYVFEGNFTVAPGDSVTFSGEVVEYFNLTELKNLTNFVVVSQGNFFLANSVSTANANTEAYEGCLVSTCGTVTAAPNNFNEYPINDGSGDVLTDDFLLGASYVAPTVGNKYLIKGIVDFSFGEFKILPRNAADVQSTTACAVSVTENNIVYNVFPNPANNEVNIEVEGNHNVTILDINGKVMLNQITNDFTTIDVSGLASGMYLINVEGNMTKFIKN